MCEERGLIVGNVGETSLGNSIQCRPDLARDQLPPSPHQHRVDGRTQRIFFSQRCQHPQFLHPLHWRATVKAAPGRAVAIAPVVAGQVWHGH